MQENEVFILDEPFNGVDIQSNIIITQLIQKLKEMGKTILISSHIFSTLNETCDEIHLMEKGVFEKRVLKPDFGKMENEMRDFIVGDKLEMLDLKWDIDFKDSQPFHSPVEGNAEMILKSTRPLFLG